MQETRKSNRIAKRIDAHLRIATHMFPIVIRNISATGLCASIRANVPVGTRCNILFSYNKVSYTLQGTIVRCKHNEVGISFTNLSKEQKQILSMLL